MSLLQLGPRMFQELQKEQVCYHVMIAKDTEIVEESFLEDVANMLSSGEVPNLFTGDELSAIRANLEKAGKDRRIMQWNKMKWCEIDFARFRVWLSKMERLSRIGDMGLQIRGRSTKRITGSQDCSDSRSYVRLLHLAGSGKPSYCRALRLLQSMAHDAHLWDVYIHLPMFI